MDYAGFVPAASRCDEPPQYQSTGRTVLETILWIAIIAAYIPQYLRIRWEGTKGISPYYMLNHSLFSTTTLALRLSHNVFFAAFNCVVSGELSGWKAYSASLGFVEVIVQWLCSVLLLVVYIRYRIADPHPEEVLSRRLSATARDLDSDELQAHKLSSQRMWIILGSYCAGTIPMSMVLVCFNTHPYFQEPQRHNSFYICFWSVWIAFLCAVDAFLVVFQFIKQMKTVGRLQTRGSLSIVSMGLQSVTFILLSMAQLFRSRRNIILRRESHIAVERFLQLFAYVYGCVSVDVMYLVAGLGYLVLFQLCLVFDWNDLFGRRFGRIQLL